MYKVQKIGRINIVIIITVFSIIFSLLLTFFLSIVFSRTLDGFDYTTSAIIPMFVAPFASWFLVGLLVKLDKLESNLTYLATYDDLTELLNRRAFYEVCENLHRKAKLNKTNYCILLTDLDYFKSVNDNYGHATGDNILSEFGKICLELSGKTISCGRLGGEEFGFLLPDMDLKESEIFAKKLLLKTANIMVKHDDKPVNITTSIGLAQKTKHIEAPMEGIISRADKALYIAKETGRNKVVTYIEETL